MERQRPPVCDYEGSDYQARFWDQGERAYEDRVEAIALGRLLPATGGRLLEVGAGAGRNTPRYRGYRRIVLLDYSRTQLEQARDRLGVGERYLYVVGDVYRLPFVPGVFDAATMIRVLHHMVEPQRALGEVGRTLQDQGVFVLEFANKRNLKAILRWVFRRQSWNPFDPEPVEFAELNFDFHPRAVYRWLRESGFRIGPTLAVSHFRWEPLKRWVPLRVLVGLDALAQWTGNWWQLTPSVFVRARASGGPRAAEEGSIWRCPVCGSHDMQQGEEGVRCTSCGRLWPRRDGIYDFREPQGG